MWQADPAVWARTSPVLFPIVGKLKNDCIFIQGKSFTLKQHGFARDKVFSPEQCDPLQASFTLHEDDSTLSQFPFSFLLQISYELKNRTIRCKWRIDNTGTTEMPFSIGAHPGFNLIGHRLEDYVIEWEKEHVLNRHLLSDGLFNHQTETIYLQNKQLQLNPALFEKDAIVLKDQGSGYIQLKHLHSDHQIQVDFEGFPYLGIWTKKDCRSFLCIEPWFGLADAIEGQDDILHKEGIQVLPPGESFNMAYSMTFTI